MSETVRRLPTDPSSHPEEIRSEFNLTIGRHVSVNGTARITPAGVLCAGIAVAAMTLALGYAVRAARTRGKTG